MGKMFKKVPGAMEELGEEVKNLHFWSCHAEVLDVEDCFTNLSDVACLRVDSEKAAEWLKKYAAVSELMMTLNERGMSLELGREYWDNEDSGWLKWSVA